MAYPPLALLPLDQLKLMAHGIPEPVTSSDDSSIVRATEARANQLVNLAAARALSLERAMVVLNKTVKRTA